MFDVCVFLIFESFSDKKMKEGCRYVFVNNRGEKKKALGRTA